MFDLDASKLIVVGIVALAVIPPKDLPRVLRTVGQYVGKMRRMASEFQGQFMDAMKEAEKAADLESVKKEFASLDESAKFDTAVKFDTSFDVNAALNRESSKHEPIDPADSAKSIDSPKSIAGPEVAAEAEPIAPPGEPFSSDVVVKAPQIPEATPSAESHAPSAP
jgi:sec-independent protein translocase protein TatB